MDNTLRQKIINDFKEAIDMMVDPDTNERVWATVLQGSIDTVVGVSCPAIGLSEGSEDVDYSMYPMVTKTLRLYVDFKIRRKLDENAYEVFNKYLGLLQKDLLDLGSYDNIVKRNNIAVREVTNGNNILTQNDTFVIGNLVIDVEYRHKQGDPYINTGKRSLINA